IAPSSSLTFTYYVALHDAVGGARRGHTVVLNGVDGAAGMMGAAFAYDEVAGQPRLTRLSADAAAFHGGLVDINSAQPSEYFAFSPGCQFGRIRVDGTGTPFLESSSCPQGLVFALRRDRHDSEW